MNEPLPHWTDELDSFGNPLLSDEVPDRPMCSTTEAIVLLHAVANSPVDLENDGEVCVRIPKHIWESVGSSLQPQAGST
jgi:hypothetical protein